MYLSAFSVYRLINVAGLLTGYMLSVLLKKAVVLGKPMAANIEPINLCNLKCLECPTGTGDLTRPKGQISLNRFNDLLDKLKKSAWFVNLYFQGEPFMHPEFPIFVEKAKKARLITSTSTNAHYLSKAIARKVVEAGLDIIILSFDGLTQEVYKKYRVNGQIDRVFEGLHNLVEAKKELNAAKPVIIGQFLAFKHNEHQIQEFKKQAFELGLDKAEIKTAQIYNVTNKQYLLPTQKSLSRYTLLADGTAEIKGRTRNRCWKHWSSCVITWDSELIPCCFDKNASYSFGNLDKYSLNQIWFHPHYNAFRNKILTSQEEIDICKNCPLSRG
jgi:radical SAM protein with 4Fe4S-binding SPASM domain